MTDITKLLFDLNRVSSELKRTVDLCERLSVDIHTLEMKILSQPAILTDGLGSAAIKINADAFVRWQGNYHKRTEAVQSVVKEIVELGAKWHDARKIRDELLAKQRDLVQAIQSEMSGDVKMAA
jgi:hypothetical protein